jgi:hypothetical protein
MQVLSDTCAVWFAESIATEQKLHPSYIYVHHLGHLDIGPRQICTSPYTLHQQCNVSIYRVYICIMHECITLNDIRGLSPFSTYYTVPQG